MQINLICGHQEDIADNINMSKHMVLTLEVLTVIDPGWDYRAAIPGTFLFTAKRRDCSKHSPACLSGPLGFLVVPGSCGIIQV